MATLGSSFRAQTISGFNGSVATYRKRYIIYNTIFVVYFNYALAGFDSQQVLILVMHPFLIENCFFKPTTSTLFIQKKSTTLVNRKGRIEILHTLDIKKYVFQLHVHFTQSASISRVV